MTATIRKPVGRPKDEELPARRRQEILDAAGMFFARLGYPNADLRLLADELGVAKGTLYRYFPSKKDLFLATVDNCILQLNVKVREAWLQADSPLGRIEKALSAFFGFFDAHPHAIELIVQERAEFKDRPVLFQTELDGDNNLWQAHFSELIASDVLREVPVTRLIETMNSLVYGVIFNKYVTGADENLQAKTSGVLDILFNGLMKDNRRYQAFETGQTSTQDETQGLSQDKTQTACDDTQSSPEIETIISISSSNSTPCVQK